MPLSEELVELLEAHPPVIGRFAHLNGIVGCQCMDRVFVAGQESYAEHLALMVESIVAAREAKAARRALLDAADLVLSQQIRLQDTYRKPDWSDEDKAYDEGIQHCAQVMRDRAASVAGGNEDGGQP